MEPLVHQSDTTVIERSTEHTVPPLRHIYPGPYPGSGPGWIAYCGHVKTTPWSGRYARDSGGRDQCVVCVEMRTARRL